MLLNYKHWQCSNLPNLLNFERDSCNEEAFSNALEGRLGPGITPVFIKSLDDLMERIKSWDTLKTFLDQSIQNFNQSLIDIKRAWANDAKRVEDLSQKQKEIHNRLFNIEAQRVPLHFADVPIQEREYAMENELGNIHKEFVNPSNFQGPLDTLDILISQRNTQVESNFLDQINEQDIVRLSELLKNQSLVVQNLLQQLKVDNQHADVILNLLRHN